MCLRANHREKDGTRHTYWSLVETVRTVDGPRQRTLCHLGELNDSAQARWLKTIDVFNAAGDQHQLKLFPSDIAPPPDDAEVAQVLVQWVFDRGIVSDANLAAIRRRGGQYLVGTRRSALRHVERALLAGSWTQIRDEVEAPLVPIPGGTETYVLCWRLCRVVSRIPRV